MRLLATGIILLLMCITACDPEKETETTWLHLHNGRIDLSNHDFLSQGPVALSGTWEFYWNRFIVSQKYNGKIPDSPDYIFVPRSWPGSLRKDGTLIPHRGYASYRAVIDLPENISGVGIYIPFVYSSYRVYVSDTQGNMCLAGSGGEPGPDQSSTRHLFVPLTASFQAPGAVTVVVEAADFSTTYGGLRYVPVLGLPKQIFKEHWRRIARDLFAIGSLLIIGLYNLVIFLLRRNEKAPFWLGVSCIVMAFRTYLKGRYFEQSYPSSESFDMILKMSFFSMYILLPGFMSFLHAAFSRYISRKVPRLLWIATSLLLIFVLVTPVHAGYQSLVVFHAIVIFSCCYGFFVLIRGAWHDNNYLVYVSLAGLAVFFLFTAIDVLEANGIIRAPHITHMGLLIFIFAQAFIVASQNATARSRMENLSQELTRKSADLKQANTQLSDLNINLENKIIERTTQLETANSETVAALEEMESINESLIRANLDLENAQRIMRRDMDMAEQVQSRFLLKSPPSVTGWDIAFTYRAMAVVSGDFYDFYTSGERLNGLSLFDVSGHGIASALVTMIAKSLIFRVFRSNPDLPLNEVMDIINEELIAEIGSVGNFLTGIILRIDGNNIEYVNGAHTNLLRRKGGTGEISIIQPPDGDIRGKLVGINTIPDTYTGMTFPVETGDSLLLYSDCLIESANNDGRYGLERLQASFRSAPGGLNAQQMLDLILDDFFSFTGKTSLQDDLTVIIALKTG